MAQLTFLSAIGVGLLILNPILAPAQEVQYASVTYHENTLNSEKDKGKGQSSASFTEFRQEFSQLASVMQEAYPNLTDFSYDRQRALTHTFFTNHDQRIHVVFNKKNRPVLEVITLTPDTYPAALVQQMNNDYPMSEMVTVKHISSLYNTWYEIIIRNDEGLQKVEVVVD